MRAVCIETSHFLQTKRIESRDLSNLLLEKPSKSFLLFAMVAISDLPKLSPSTQGEEKDVPFEEFLQTLPKQNSPPGYPLAQYKGFWLAEHELRGALTFRKYFKPNDTDIILVTQPKSGTTWLKALTFSILNRKKFPISESALLSTNPHHLVPFLELDLYLGGKVPDMNSIPSPRIFATHLAYQCLPNTILDASKCRIIYLCRNPLDTFTSLMHFISQNDLLPKESQSISVDGIFELFCEGTFPQGPIWDHILGYWEASSNNPKKILFLKYEDLIKDINSSVKKMAEFLGCAFSAEEDNEGLVEEVTKICSLENLKNLECNKKGETPRLKYKYSSFFRKGGVGDWVNFLQPSVAGRLEKLMKEKFGNSGLAFDIHG